MAALEALPSSVTLLPGVTRGGVPPRWATARPLAAASTAAWVSSMPAPQVLVVQ